MSLEWIVTEALFDGPSLLPPAAVTFRRVSAQLVGEGLYRNTIDELERLNSFAPGAQDIVLAGYFGPGVFNPSVSLFFWVQIDTGGGGSSSVTTEAHLRLTQRNDGAGIAKHPRLKASASPPSSVQHGVSPRIGHVNRYR